MKAFLILMISLLSLGSIDELNDAHVQNTTTYYFIRHTEKDETDPENRDPELSAVGMERAEKWLQVFKDVEFDIILSTDYKRTRNTAAAIANTQKKEVSIYDPKKINDPDFQQKTKGKTVLVVGHSNTNPAFVNSVLGTEKYQALDEKEYGSLFIVTVGPGGDKTSQVLFIN